MSLRNKFKQNENARLAVLQASELEALDLELQDYASRLKEKIERAAERMSRQTRLEFDSLEAYKKAVLQPLQFSMNCVNLQPTDITREKLEALQGYRAVHAVLRDADVDIGCSIEVSTAKPTAGGPMVKEMLGLFRMFTNPMADESFDTKPVSKKPKQRIPRSSLTIYLMLDQPYKNSYLKVAPALPASKDERSGYADFLDGDKVLLLGSSAVGKTHFFDEFHNCGANDPARIDEIAKSFKKQLSEANGYFAVTKYPVPAPGAVNISARDARKLNASLQKILENSRGPKQTSGKMGRQQQQGL